MSGYISRPDRIANYGAKGIEELAAIWTVIPVVNQVSDGQLYNYSLRSCQALPTNLPKPVRTSSMTLIPEPSKDNPTSFRRLAETCQVFPTTPRRAAEACQAVPTKPHCDVFPTSGRNPTSFRRLAEDQPSLVLASPSISTFTFENHHLSSEPMDFAYYSIRRKEMSQGGEWIGLMIDG